MIFAPIDNQGPDARRQQLISKLMEQVQQNTAANASTMMPPGLARTTPLGASVGAPFHGVDSVQQTARPNITQSTNILPSVLAKLGALGGAPQNGEVSPGYGIAIPLPTADVVNLHMPTPDGQGPPSAPIPPAPIPTSSAPQPTGPMAPSPAPLTNPVGRIPLGNGAYYDPVLDAVLFHPTTPIQTPGPSASSIGGGGGRVSVT